MKLSEDFDSREFACHCGCGYQTVDPKLVEELQELRNELKASISITSGARCAKHNKAVGGAPNSYHVKGMAADIKVKDHSPAEVYSYLVDKYPGKYGLGLYPSWVHFDIRPTGIWRGKK